MSPVATVPTISLQSQDHNDSPDVSADLRLSKLNLKSNGGAIKPDTIGWLKPLDRSLPWEDIRKQYEEDGYVLVKGLLPVEDVREMRRKYFEFVQDTGILKEGTDAVDGIYCGAPPDVFGGPAGPGPGDPSKVSFIDRLTEAHKAEFYREFHSHPRLFEFAQHLTQWDDILLLQRQLLRVNAPGAQATAVHFDQIYLRGGPPTFLTAWVPIGHCDVEVGGLIYLEKSHDIGKRIEADFGENAKNLSEEERVSAFNANMMKDGVLSQDADRFARNEGEGRKWLVANYEDGDVVFHHPYMIHASAVNQSPEGRIRLSTDLRFVNRNEPYDERWSNHWVQGDGL